MAGDNYQPLLKAVDTAFPEDALRGTVQEFPKVSGEPFGSSVGSILTWVLSSVADAITPWGRNVQLRDKQLREFWPTETYLAGALASTAMRNAAFEWELEGPEKLTTPLYDMFNGAIAGDAFGWIPYVLKISADLYSQDNGAFTELIRDPGIDVNSRFRGPNAPVVGIAHLDANNCQRTGNPEFPVLYTDIKGKVHKLRWYEVIPMSDFPSPQQSMFGVGVCAVTRALRMAQVLQSIAIFKAEKIGGRHYRSLHLVGGVSRTEIQDALTRGQEEADNKGQIRFILPAILASLDPEKPVSTAKIDLASLPDGFDLDAELKWYISALSLSFGVDYQDLAPLSSGGLGSSQQSEILHRKAAGKGPAIFMQTVSQSWRNYGVIPKNVRFRFKESDLAEEANVQAIRTKALEEIAIAVRAGVLTPEAARDDLVRRNIYTEETIAGIPSHYGLEIIAPKQNVGERGGNTFAEDAARVESGRPEEGNRSRRLEKIIDFLRGR